MSKVVRNGGALQALIRDIRQQVHEVLDIVYTRDPNIASLRDSARKNSDRLENSVEEAKRRWNEHRKSSGCRTYTS